MHISVSGISLNSPRMVIRLIGDAQHLINVDCLFISDAMHLINASQHYISTAVL
jgi:hypothetical protein